MVFGVYEVVDGRLAAYVDGPYTDYLFTWKTAGRIRRQQPAGVFVAASIRRMPEDPKPKVKAPVE